MNNNVINRVFYKNRLKLKYNNFIEFTTTKYYENYVKSYTEMEEKYFIKYNKYTDYIMLYHLEKYNLKILSQEFKNKYKDELSSAQIMYNDMSIIYEMIENIISN
jgi:hypothetical protein